MEKEEILKPIPIKDLGTMYATENSKKRKRFGLYKCGFCGNEFRTQTSLVKNGNTMSCGCYHIKRVREGKTKHGLSNTRLNRIWSSIKDRTLNSKQKQYNDYGGRGISICDEWKNDFLSFYNWAMTNGYEENKGLSIDRIDNDGNYCPENCRWTTRVIQGRNQRMQKNNTSGFKGVSYNKRAGSYQTCIQINSKKIHLGYFQTAVEGAIAYNNYIIENNLEGFILNEISEEYLKQSIKEEN